MSDLYDDDLLEWSEQQAALLRRRAAGELVNDRELDWANIAEEIEDVGSNRLHAVQSYLRQAMIHRLKAAAWPQSGAVAGWMDEELGFRQEAADRYTPAMHQKLDLSRLYAQALRRLPAQIDGLPPLPVPQACPWTLEQLLAD